eukprot:2791478-Prorocentrum_lima.AAC.1
MTSSLVGSEMCIRDRYLSRPCWRWTCRRRRCGACTASRPCAAQGRPAPVSYTHLTLPTICSV